MPPPITGGVGGTLDTNTLLLVHADGTNGSTSFTDVSTYARTLTASGGSKVNTSNPKFGSGAADFSANTGNYINVGNPIDFNFGANQFTIEAWGYFTGYNADADILFAQWTASLGYNFIFGFVSNKFVCYYTTTGNSANQVTTLATAFTPTTNTWYHFAVDRDAGGTARLYINGAVMIAQAMPALPMVGGTPAYIGNNPDYLFQAFPGYLDELRVSNVARYAGAFTPPSAPFSVGALPLAQAAQTLSATGTVVTPPLPLTGTLGPVPIASPSCVLLMHADGAPGSTTFTDSSLNAHTLTASNSAQISNTQTMFGFGSATFPSGTSIIDIGSATDFNLGAGPFTIEAWVYFTSSPAGNNVIASQWGASGVRGWYFSVFSTSLNFTYTTDGVTQLSVTLSNTLLLNQWFHIAIDRDVSNTLRFYINGAVVNSSSLAATIYASSANGAIGNLTIASVNFKGYLDEVRVTKGRAMYGGAFTPPTQPFSAPSTVLLMHNDDHLSVYPPQFTDSSLNANALTDPLNNAVNVSSITVTPKFGAGSLSLLGATSASVQVTNDIEDFHFGAGPFTVEAWGYLTSTPDGFSPQSVAAQTNFGTFNLGWAFLVRNVGLIFSYSTNGSVGATITGAATLTLNTWAHFAVDFDGTTVRLYYNGAVVGTGSLPAAINPATLPALIGNTGDLTRAFPGYLDEVRITKGVAQYAGAFTPPTQAFLPGYTIGLTQDAQTLAATGTVASGAAITGTLSRTQADQTLAATAGPVVRGTLSTTQAPQTLVATGVLTVVGTLSQTQDAQTLSAAGTVAATVIGTLNLTQAAHIIAAAGSVPNPAALALTEQPDTLAATAGLTVRGTLALPEQPDTLAATGASTIVGTLARTQASHTLVATAGPVVTGTLALTEQPDTLAGTGTLGAVVGTLVLTEQPDTLAAVGALSIIGTLALTEQPDTLAATGALPITATLARTQAPNTVVTTGVITVGGTLAVTEHSDTLVAAGNVVGGVTGSLGITQADQMLSASGGPVLVGTLSTAQATQTLVARADLAVGGTLARTQADQTLAATTDLTVRGFLNATQVNHTLAAAGVTGPFVAPGFIPSSEIVYAPTFKSNVAFVLPEILSTATLPSPTFLPGPVTLVSGFIPSSEILFAPVVHTVGVLHPAQIPSSEIVYQPTLIVEGFLHPGVIPSAETAFRPTLIPGAAGLPVDFILNTDALFAPTMGTALLTHPPPGVYSAAFDVPPVGRVR